MVGYSYPHLSEFLTLDIVKKSMLKYVKRLPVLDMDLRAIIVDGWDRRALEDSTPRCMIFEEIEELIGDDY